MSSQLRNSKKQNELHIISIIRSSRKNVKDSSHLKYVNNNIKNIRKKSQNKSKELSASSTLSTFRKAMNFHNSCNSLSHTRTKTTNAKPAVNINTNNNAIVNNLGNIWDNYIQNNPSAKTAKYDANRVTEYDYSLASTQQGDMKDAILTASRNMPLKEVDYNNKTRKFENTGNELSLKDLKSDKYKVTATRFSPYGATVMVQDNEGNVKRYALPSGINTTNDTNRDKMMVAAPQWLQVVNTGQYTDAKGKVHKATPDEITYAQEQYAQALQQAYLFHSQLGVQNKTKEQEFNPYGY